jgi:hypothetical protein
MPRSTWTTIETMQVATELADFIDSGGLARIRR